LQWIIRITGLERRSNQQTVPDHGHRLGEAIGHVACGVEQGGGEFGSGSIEEIGGS
jgi:hypothetical protein